MHDPYHVYLDLDVINNDYTHVGSPPYLRFEEIRNTPFLDGDSSDYFCSIVRFTVQTANSLPLFIPVVEQGQNTRNKTIYRVSLKYAYRGETFIKTVPIQYYPEDSTAPLPEPPINKQDLTSNYYYVYNYNHFIGMINLALETAFNLITTDLINLDYHTSFETTVSPFLDFDPHTNKIILYADFFAYDEVYTGITGTPPVEIYFNERLYDLCIGLPTSRVSKTGDLNYKLRVINNRSNLVPKYVPLNSTKIVDGVTKTVFELKKFDFVMIQQEISSIALWNPVASIIFASSLLPIQSTQTSLPKDVGSSNNSFTGSGNNSNLLPAITDFTIAVDGNNQFRPMVVYNPSAEYRLVDMHSAMNLNRIDIIVYWKDTFGNIHPFELHPGCSANVKLLFRRKDFNTNS